MQPGPSTAGMVPLPLCHLSLIPARGFTQGSARHSRMSPAVSSEEGGMWQGLVRTKAFLCGFGMLSPQISDGPLLLSASQPAGLFCSSVCPPVGTVAVAETCWLLRMLETKLL